MADKKININITIISDVICPWCWVAKRKLERAIDMASDKYNFRIHMEPFKLKPNVGPAGEAKPQPTASKPRVSDKLKQAGEAVGINFSGKADRYPDVTPSHALLVWAESLGKHMELEEAIYKAYFTDGVFLDNETLMEIATTVGLDRDAARAAITDTEVLDDVTIKARYWSSRVKGVPCFYMNGVEAFQGGREPEEFVRMFEVIAQNYPQ